jgi:class 3 adenylate cyclase
VLFADLVGSMELAARLDPEKLSVVLGAYRNCCTDLVQEFDGAIAQFQGDGIIAHFVIHAPMRLTPGVRSAAGWRLSARFPDCGCRQG